MNRWVRIAAVTMAAAMTAGAADWVPVKGRPMTRWAKEVAPGKALPEYPRPQMVREAWMNLNGLWDYAIVAKDAAQPGAWDGKILVPFAVESALSGVGKTVGPDNRVWYRRSFKVPAAWAGKRVLLHFGAVDWDATVWVNGRELGSHRGGYDAFSFDVTDALKPGDAAQEMVVSVWDPSDTGFQPRGKQVQNPHGIWYTPVTGIWQTPWLEPVAPAHIASLTIVPDVDAAMLRVAVNIQNPISNSQQPTAEVRIMVLDGTKEVAAGSGKAGEAVALRIAKPRLWSPDSPFLYDLKVALLEGGRVVDEVASYAGLRKIAVAPDKDGILRLMLNNAPLFQYGPLDQGWWPDGLYTAPTDEALRYDIEMTKAFGMNMARKHVKVEPARWYTWCDKLGLLVWQDMPSGNFGDSKTDKRRSDEATANFEHELTAMVTQFGNHPSIVMWVPFNEGWGQHETPRIVDFVRKLDPTRPVNEASGWTDRGSGDVKDIHAYPGPAVPKREDKRVAVLGEFGGLGLPVKGHTWQEEKNWGYRSFTTAEDLTDAYLALLEKLHPMTGAPGLSAAVYTQTTDVEVEVNGLMTYDREVVKMDLAAIAAAAKKLYSPPAPRVQKGDALVPPAAPLVACDPYFSVWSQADELAGTDTTHWTGKPHRLASLVRIDGKPFRLMGASPRTVPALPQTGLTVLPTRTVYTFKGAGIELTLTFTTPALPDDIDILSRPVTYLTYDARSTDGREHAVQVFFDACGELTVNEPKQEVVGADESAGDLAVLKLGSKDQPVLMKKGDDIRIDWGWLYVAAPKASVATASLTERGAGQRAFAAGAALPAAPAMPCGADAVSAAVVLDLGRVGAKPASRWLMVAYDDLYSIQYMKSNLRPYWRRNGWEAADLLKASAKEREALEKRCAAFDEELMDDLRKAGGEKYAKLCALAYRQCFAAGKFVADANGQPLSFCKENHSNGCIGTSDVFYPMAPQFLLLGPSVAKSFLVPFMNYAASERWKFPFAPHDLGQYPHANGQRYGGGERTEDNQMPVEESGNLLILMAAVAQMEGNPDFAGLYWPQLERWAAYLKEKGFDPENQLCTDDFAGHLAHNVNLSVKAICGLGAFAKLCDMRGDKTKAAEYGALAKEFAARWVKEARDGDHFRLAFDKPDTWSQKYNLVWDRILGLNLFPPDVAKTEMAFYRKTQNKYGLPLDNRSDYTKLDWILWTATLTQDRGDFEALVDPVYRFLNETPDRSPMTDWYFTSDARKRGFTARPVVGGVFLQTLYDKALWSKWAGRDATKAANYAPMPKPPVLMGVLPTAEEDRAQWKFVLRKPDGEWFKPGFDDASWRQGRSGFGTKGTPASVIGTEWSTKDIWLRRTVTLPDLKGAQVQLRVHHDEDAEIYLNGVLAATLSGFTTEYEAVPIAPAAAAALKPGPLTIAIHCRQTGGGQYIDAGLVQAVPAK
jgi:hypothetical protein